MPHCPKCGARVSGDMAFCPQCGAPLKVEEPVSQAAAESMPRREYRHEKEEKVEKYEKGEKYEKHEKYESREFGFMGPLIGGLFLILLGLTSYLQILGYEVWRYAWAFFLIAIGVIIVVGAIYALKRYPRP